MIHVPGLKFETLDAVKDAVRAARGDCQDWLRRNGYRHSFLRSRGTHLHMRSRVDALSGEGESDPWDGTGKSLDALLRAAQADPRAETIYLEGGFNAADSLDAFDAYDYEPWAGEWSVVLWERPSKEQS